MALFDDMFTGSTVIKKTTSPGQKAAFLGVGLVLASALGVFLGAYYVPGGGILSIGENFREYVTVRGQILIGFTGATPMLVLTFDFAVFIIWAFYAIRIDHPYSNEEYGNAKWGDPKAFCKSYADTDKSHEVTLRTGDIKLLSPVKNNPNNRQIAEGVYIDLRNGVSKDLKDPLANINMLVIGPQGSGKTFRVVMPILFSGVGRYDVREGSSFIVTDPKGELYPKFGQFFRDNGYEVLIVDIRDERHMTQFSHYNPFVYIKSEADILKMASNLYDSAKKKGDKDDPFFDPSAKMILQALIDYIMYELPQEARTWSSFVELLRDLNLRQTSSGRIDAKAVKIYQKFSEANKKWKEKYGESEQFPGFDTIDQMYHGAYDTTAGIVSSLLTRTQYMRLDEVQEFMNDDDLDLVNGFGRCKSTKDSPAGKRILFIATAQEDHIFDWITSLLYSQLISILYRISDNEFGGELPIHTTLLMDEAANVVLPEDLANILSTARSHNLSATMIYQDPVQIKGQLPENDEDQKLTGMFSIIQVLGPPSQKSCEELSKLFGDMTIHKQSSSQSTNGSFVGSGTVTDDVIKRPLLPPQEISKLKPNGPCPIYIKGSDPLFVPKVQMQKRHFLPLISRKKFRYERKKRAASCLLDIFTGEEAKRQLEIAEDLNEKVTVITEADLEAMIFMDAKKEVVFDEEGIKKAAEAWKKESKEALIDFNDYAGNSVYLVQRLIRKGFSPRQIHAMDPLIRREEGDVEEKIKEIDDLFSPEMDELSIKGFVETIGSA